MAKRIMIKVYETNSEAWRGEGCPLPIRGEVWEGGTGAVPLPRKFLDFCFENGAFWRVLKGFINVILRKRISQSYVVTDMSHASHAITYYRPTT